jgi:hypothetical protein
MPTSGAHAIAIRGTAHVKAAIAILRPLLRTKVHEVHIVDEYQLQRLFNVRRKQRNTTEYCVSKIYLRMRHQIVT